MVEVSFQNKTAITLREKAKNLAIAISAGGMLLREDRPENYQVDSKLGLSEKSVMLGLAVMIGSIGIGIVAGSDRIGADVTLAGFVLMTPKWISVGKDIYSDYKYLNRLRR